tara:strand:+ start:1021 stop:1410 length:390 start_codon:yes stop_codon:yes gene_type:complete
MFLSLYFLYSWNLNYIDLVTAKTTIRLWHELHVVQKKEHDFQSLISPQKDGFYVAAVRHDEIRSIALCKRNDLSTIYVKMIAHPPDQLNGPVELLSLLRKNNLVLSKEIKNFQPRWYYENMYYKTRLSE